MCNPYKNNEIFHILFCCILSLWSLVCVLYNTYHLGQDTFQVLNSHMCLGAPVPDSVVLDPLGQGLAMGLSLDPHNPLYRETWSSHLAHNHIPSPPRCPGTMFMLLGDPQAQPSSSRPWDQRKASKALPLPVISSENSQHQGVHILGWPGSGPFSPHIIPTPQEGVGRGCRQPCSQAGKGLC